MFKAKIFILPIALISSLLLAQPPDVAGYRNIKWKSTVEQVRQVVGVDAGKLNDMKDGTTKLVMPIKVVNTKCDLHFQFEKGTLSRVLIVPEQGEYGVIDFNAFLDELTKKYGQPADVNSSRDSVALRKTATWSFASTSISLKLTNAGYGICLFYIEYEPRSSKTNDGL